MTLRALWRYGRLALAFGLLLVNLAAQAPAPRAAAAPRPLPPAESPNPAALIVRVYFTTLADRDRLASQLDAQETSTSGGYVTAIVDKSQYQTLVAAGHRVEIDDARTALLNNPAQPLQNQAGGIPGFPCYRTVEETYASLAQLAGSHLNLASWVDVGESWRKVTSGGAAGYDLNVLVLTNKSKPGPKPIFFLMAAIHAREYATAEIATRFAEYLVGQYGLDPDVTWLLDDFEVVIMPQANPDGRKVAEAGYYQRKNVNNTNGGACNNPATWWNQFGTDLNRNSSFQWGGSGSSNDTCDQVYRGPTRISEPETKAIQSEMASLFPNQRGPALTDTVPVTASGVFITLHSYGELVLFPWGFTSDPAPNHDALQTLARKFGFYNGYTVCQAPVGGCLYTTSGTTDDWAYGQLGVASYTFEVGSDFFEPCDNFEATIWPANRPALLYALKAARRPYQNPAGPETIQVTTTTSLFSAGLPLTLTAIADDTRYASGGQGNEPSQNIAAARYSLDAPAWAPCTRTDSLPPADGVFNSPVENLRAVVDTSQWSAGQHLLFVESRDSDGNWGVPSAVFVAVLPINYAFALSGCVLTGTQHPGGAIAYSLSLTQTGLLTDTYSLSVAGNAWPVAVPETLGPMPPGATANFSVTVTVPAGAANGSHDVVSLTVTSAGDPARHHTLTLDTMVLYKSYFPLIGR